MDLDPNTTNVIAGVGSMVLGAAQLSAWRTGRFGTWAGCWGAGNLAFGIGALGLHFIGVLPDYVTISVANVIALCGHLLTLQAVRLFVGRRPHWRLLAAAAATLAIPLLLSYDPARFAPRVAYNTTFRAVCDAWIVAEIVRLAIRQKLSTAWTMAATFAAMVPICLSRAFFALAGALGASQLTGGTGLPHWLGLAAATLILLQATTLMAVAAERSYQAVSDQARLDALTGALNRVGLAELRASLAGAVALILFDLDHFKALNDRRGHACGDSALRLVGEAARGALPSAGAFVRLGGDEFLAVLPGGDADDAARIADRIRAAFAATIGAVAIEAPFPTLSVGVAAGDLASIDFETLTARADAALYAAKRDGRDRISISRLAA